jgi:hypothetical protein
LKLLANLSLGCGAGVADPLRKIGSSNCGLRKNTANFLFYLEKFCGSTAADPQPRQSVVLFVTKMIWLPKPWAPDYLTVSILYCF